MEAIRVAPTRRSGTMRLVKSASLRFLLRSRDHYSRRKYPDTAPVLELGLTSAIACGMGERDPVDSVRGRSTVAGNALPVFFGKGSSVERLSRWREFAV